MRLSHRPTNGTQKMIIQGSTGILGVFGDPIEHSKSPIIHNEFARETNSNFVYVPFRVYPSDLSSAIRVLPKLSIRGVNITVPHKEACISALDQLTETAKKIGAVNTIINQGGILTGDNSDAHGFLSDLQAKFPAQPWEEAPSLVLGAGGAAKAIAYALNQTGTTAIWVANRTVAKARNLIDSVCPEKGEELGLSTDQLNSALGQCSLVVNTTSLGLKGETFPNLDLRQAKPGTVFYDLIYNPKETPLLAQARSQGMETTNGLGMLVRQGALSFEMWTGSRPSVEPVIQMLDQ